jgi:hypothetical protein
MNTTTRTQLPRQHPPSTHVFSSSTSGFGIIFLPYLSLHTESASHISSPTRLSQHSNSSLTSADSYDSPNQTCPTSPTTYYTSDTPDNYSLLSVCEVLACKLHINTVHLQVTLDSPDRRVFFQGTFRYRISVFRRGFLTLRLDVIWMP